MNDSSDFLLQSSPFDSSQEAFRPKEMTPFLFGNLFDILYNMKKQAKKRQFTPKSFDTKMETIQKESGVDFGVDPNKKLGVFLRERGYKSLAKMLQEA